MKQQQTDLRTSLLALTCLVVFGLPMSALAAAPSQKPLLVGSTGAKPNVVLMIDNSGSMSFPSVIMPTTNHFIAACPSGYTVQITNAGPESVFYACWNSDFSRVSPGNQTTYSARKYRSPNYWDLQYDPRKRYIQRKDESGNNVAATVKNVINQNNFRIGTGGSSFDEYNAPTYQFDQSGGSFDSYICTNADCSQALQYRQRFGFPPKVLPYTPNAGIEATYNKFPARTDCAGTQCTEAEEWKNIANWYSFYKTRIKSSTTAIGFALNNPDFNNKLRLGYGWINKTDGSAATSITRGVRLFSSDDATKRAEKKAIFDAIYTMVPTGGTPLHNATSLVASYYGTESPWLKDPSKAEGTTLVGTDKNTELSCRRSFHILFSDGAWNSGTSNLANSGTDDFDNKASTARSRPATSTATPATLAYSPTGNTDRGLYTPYPSSATTGLADLTAKNYWHTDFRTADNNVPTRVRKTVDDLEPRSPSFWQNMTTYTVGYGIKPSGELPTTDPEYKAAGLTFAQIQKYQSEYFTLGYNDATKPAWATGNLNSGNIEADRVDDFIQAGYTGGGFGASVNTPDEVRDVFNKIVAGILEANGNDAGVAASAGSSAFTDFAGLLKYDTSYSTKNNTGEIKAYTLDKFGAVTATAWTASLNLPLPSLRKVYSISNDPKIKGPFEFTGSFDKLPADVKTALNPAGVTTVPTDDSFVRYLRGVDPIQNTNKISYRVRDEKYAASVNSPPAYVAGRVDLAYDLAGTVQGGTVSATDAFSEGYYDYILNKRSYPPSLMEATNAGMVHVLNAKTGTELAAFMPRRAMTKLLSSYANPAYQFEYVLDGMLAEQDIFNTSNKTDKSAWAWNQVVVGTGGRAGKFAFALRSPLNEATTLAFTTKNRTPGKADFLWEIGEEDVKANDVAKGGGVAMGYMTQNAKAGQTYNGEWVTILNSGHYNDGNDGLIVVDAITGAHIKSIPLPATYDAGRGLGGATLIRDANKRVVGAYAGDANGHMWRFNMLGAPGEWDVSYDRPLFTEPNGRPIYAAPTWQNHTKGGTIVVFGTGILLGDDDLSDVNTQYLYGIWDPMLVGSKLNTIKLASLEDSSKFTLLEQTVEKNSTKSDKLGVPLYTVSRNIIDWSKHRGWRLALGQITDNPNTGERVIGDAANLGSSVVISSVVRSNQSASDVEVCTAAAGNPPNFKYVIDALSGGGKLSYDADDDGTYEDYSVGYYASGGYARNTVLNIKSSVDYYASSIINEGIGKKLRLAASVPSNEGMAPILPIPTDDKCLLNFGETCSEEVTYDATPCGTLAAELGINGAANIADGCAASKGWKRNWRQVITPPV